MTTTTLPLGTRVRVRRVLVRHGGLRRTRDSTVGEVRTWVSVPVCSALWTHEIYVDGIIAGHRTLTEGTTAWGGEDGTTYQATASAPAYLVAWAPRRKLVRVRPEDLEVLPWPDPDERVDVDDEPDPRDVLL